MQTILSGLKLPVALLDELGYPYKELENDDYLLPVLACNGTFHSPAFLMTY